MENDSHGHLIFSTILETKWHYLVIEICLGSYEVYLFYVIWIHPDLKQFIKKNMSNSNID